MLWLLIFLSTLYKHDTKYLLKIGTYNLYFKEETNYPDFYMFIMVWKMIKWLKENIQLGKLI